MSVRKNGPIGAAFAAATPWSIAVIERPPSSCSRQTSPTEALRIRLTTKPGTSPQTIGCFLIACAKLSAVATVSGAVSSLSMISSSGITDAG